MNESNNIKKKLFSLSFPSQTVVGIFLSSIEIIIRAPKSRLKRGVVYSADNLLGMITQRRTANDCLKPF